MESLSQSNSSIFSGESTQATSAAFEGMTDKNAKQAVHVAVPSNKATAKTQLDDQAVVSELMSTTHEETVNEPKASLVGQLAEQRAQWKQLQDRCSELERTLQSVKSENALLKQENFLLKRDNHVREQVNDYLSTWNRKLLLENQALGGTGGGNGASGDAV